MTYELQQAIKALKDTSNATTNYVSENALIWTDSCMAFQQEIYINLIPSNATVQTQIMCTAKKILYVMI